MLKVKPTGVAGRLDVGCEGKKRVKMTSRFLACATEKMEWLQLRCGRLQGTRWGWERDRSGLVFAMSGLRCVLDIHCGDVA